MPLAGSGFISDFSGIKLKPWILFPHSCRKISEKDSRTLHGQWDCVQVDGWSNMITTVLWGATSSTIIWCTDACGEGSDMQKVKKGEHHAMSKWSPRQESMQWWTPVSPVCLYLYMCYQYLAICTYLSFYLSTIFAYIDIPSYAYHMPSTRRCTCIQASTPYLSTCLSVYPNAYRPINLAIDQT